MRALAQKLVFALKLGIGLTGAAAAADADWAGYYVALDRDDGSIATMSIAPTGAGDGSFEVIMQTDALSLCPDRTTGGFLIATGRVVDGELVREGGRFRCEGDAEFREWQPGSYQRDVETGIVSQSGGHDGRTFHFHPTR